MKKYQLVRNAEKMGSIIVEFLNEMHDLHCPLDILFPEMVVSTFALYGFHYECGNVVLLY